MIHLSEASQAGSIVKACLVGSSPTRGGRLVADARDQQPFEPWEWGLRVVHPGHFCASFHVGHARRIRPVFNYRNTDLEDQIKTNKKKVKTRYIYQFEIESLRQIDKSHDYSTI